MKHTLITLLMLLSAAGIFAANGIRNGSQWSNGTLLYDAKVNADGSILFTGMDEGEELAFLLTAAPDKNDEYRLTDAIDMDYCVNPFSDYLRVKHVRKEGQNLLCLYDRQGRLCDVIAPSGYQDTWTKAQEKWTRQLTGEYYDVNDKPMHLEWNQAVSYGRTNGTYNHILFNSVRTGVIEIKGGTPLDGLWKVEITTDGLRLKKVTSDENYLIFKPTGEEQVFFWNQFDSPRFGYASEILLNGEMLKGIDKPVLRLMRNEILMHHGYVPGAEDLKQYVSDQSWYTPRESNDGIYDELNTIEELNIELIKTAEAMKDSPRTKTADESDADGFDIDRYYIDLRDKSNLNLNYMKSLDEVRLVDYALIDLDNDGTPEIWVRGDEGQDFQGVFAIESEDEVVLVANSNARSELVFFPGGIVGSQGYYGEGLFLEQFSIVKNSQPEWLCFKRVVINNFSEDMEVLEEAYTVHDKDVTEKEYDDFFKSLGEPIHPKVEWHPFNK